MCTCAFFLIILWGLTKTTCDPISAYFQYGSPFYSPKAARFKLGFPKSTTQLENENVVWTYPSPEFSMAQISFITECSCHRPFTRFLLVVFWFVEPFWSFVSLIIFVIYLKVILIVWDCISICKFCSIFLSCLVDIFFPERDYVKPVDTFQCFCSDILSVKGSRVTLWFSFIFLCAWSWFSLTVFWQDLFSFFSSFFSKMKKQT